MGFITKIVPVSDWRESVLIYEQLSSAGAILSATALYIDINPINNETLVLRTPAGGEETYTFVDILTPAPGEVLIGALATDTLTALVAEINSTSVLYSAHETANLDDYFAAAPAGQAVIYRKLATTGAPDTMYGTAGTINVLGFQTYGYEVAYKTEVALPSTVGEANSARFGFSRTMVREEVHAEIEDNSLWRWDVASSAWVSAIGPAWHYKGTFAYAGSVPSAPEMAAALLNVDDCCHFSKSANDSAFWVFRHSAAGGGTIADFSWNEMTPVPNRGPSVLETDFLFSTASPVTLTTKLKAGDLITEAVILITTPFNAAASLTVGTTILGATAVMAAAHNDPGSVGTYSSFDLVAITMADNLVLTITPGASTAGTGKLSVKVQRS